MKAIASDKMTCGPGHINDPFKEIDAVSCIIALPLQTFSCIKLLTYKLIFIVDQKYQGIVSSIYDNGGYSPPSRK